MVKSPEQLLQGKVAGLQLSNYTGDPVLGLEMTIRGVNSLSGNTSPLIVIDGIPGGSLTAISSEDIESIDVLKMVLQLYLWYSWYKWCHCNYYQSC